ncbi:MAG: VWA domain-containing protein [Acidobacteria bacterium]|nr:VWA domain-containing protein [Acidobacteriota bacterium]
MLETSEGAMKNYFWSRVFLLSWLGTVLTSCGGGSSSSFLTPEEVRQIEDGVCGGKVRVFVAIDQTLSMKTAGTRSVTIEQFDPLIRKMLQCSGELAVGFIREGPGTGTERLFFPDLPKLPERPVKQDGEESYEFSDRLDAYNVALVDYKKQAETRRNEMKPKIDDFLARVQSSLERKPATSTDFNSILNIANTFLSEGVDGSNVDTRRFAIVLSDGIDTRGRPRFRFTSQATVYWVNATTDERKLAGLNVSRVESFDAAVREITGGAK